MQATLLPDDALTAELGRLAGREREATAAFVVHLAEFDARRLYEGAGYQSMFSYCRTVLRLSEDAAYNRIKAARATRLFPAIVAMLTDGSLSPTTVRLLAPHLTAENHEPLLASARRRAAGELVPAAGRIAVGAETAESCRGHRRDRSSRNARSSGQSSRGGLSGALCSAHLERHAVEASPRPAPRARALRGPVHGQRGDAGPLARSSGSPGSRRTHGRPRHRGPSCSDRAGRGPQATEVRGHVEAASESCSQRGVGCRACGRAPRSRRARRESLRVRGRGRAPMR